MVALVLMPVLMIGCGGGGGGGGGGSTNPTPRPTATPRPGAPSLTVQLRDSSNQAVDGIVTVNNVIRATSGGQVFFQPVPTGNVRITVEVNGVETSRTTAVASTGPTNFVYLVSTGVTVTPGPTSTIPPPPF